MYRSRERNRQRRHTVTWSRTSPITWFDCTTLTEWMISVLSRSWRCFSLIATGTRFTKLNCLVSEQGRVCRCWCVCTGPILFQSDPRPVFIVLAHWNTMPQVGSDVPTQTIILTLSQPVISNSFVLSAKQSSRTSYFKAFCLAWPGIKSPTYRQPGEC